MIPYGRSVPTLFALIAICLATANLHAQQPLNTELLVNGGFETSGLSGWTTVSGTPEAAAYGSADLPATSVATLVAGGNNLARPAVGTTSSTTIEQVIDVTGNAAAIDNGDLAFVMSGAFGEGPANAGNSFLRARFLNASGGQLSSFTVGSVTSTNLNSTLSLQTRVGDLLIPANTRSIEVELFIGQSGANIAYADNLSAVLVSAPVVGATLALDTELLPNTDFENGVIFDPADPNSWRITTNPGFTIVPYGSTDVPATSVATTIGGGGFLLRRSTSTSGGTATMRRTIDVSGNATDIDQELVALKLEGYFGETGPFGGTADLIAVFRNDIGTQIGTFRIGDVTQTLMNGEVTALRRRSTQTIPMGTRSIDVDLQLFSSASTSGGAAYADNFSAQLVDLPTPPAPIPLNTQILVQTDFEDGVIVDPNNLSGWRGTTNPGCEIVPYGSLNVPSTGVSSAINGGGFLVRRATNAAFNGTATIRQTIDVSGNTADIDQGLLALRLGGNFGESGSFGGSCDLFVKFRNDIGTQLSSFRIGDVTIINNNGGTLASARVGTQDIPVGTRQIEFDLQLFSNTAGETAFADKLSAELVSATAGTPPLPLNTELLVGTEFENGVIVDPGDPNAWRVMTSPGFEIVPYGDPNVPTPAIAAEMGGGNFLLTRAPSTFNGQSTMRQTIDVSGNAAAIDQGDLEFLLSAHVGESGSVSGNATLTARFRNDVGSQIGSFATDTVTALNLNEELTSILRVEPALVPVGTRSIDVDIAVGSSNSTGNRGYIDRVSAMLIPRESRPEASGVELLANGDFESSNIITPGDTRTWLMTTGVGETANYGLANTPSTAIASAIGGGNSLLRVAPSSGTGFIVLVRTIDVSDNAVEIDAGDLGIHIEAYLGGLGTDTDTARVEVDFVASNFATTTETLGPVTAADRNNVTDMLFREGDFLVPVDTRTIRIEIRFQSSGPDFVAFVDNVSARFDNETFPGSREDLDLATGVNGPATIGPFADFKTALPGEIIVLNMFSPLGSHDFKPLNLITQVFTAGAPPASPFGFPNTYVNPGAPNLFVLLDGSQNFGIFGPPIVIPGGTILQLQVPAGLAGLEALFQALVITPGANNGFFVTSNAHVVTFL
jgi:hypothetical protein